MHTDQKFIKAINHAMLYEVGKFWNPNDPEVIAGLIGTKEQRRKVGYVNNPADRGGETKYGIAQKPRPQVVVRDLNLDSAMKIYHDEYWVLSSSNALNYQLSIIHLDGAINHGTVTANKFLQMAAQVEPDGRIGPVTIAAVNSFPANQIIANLYQMRKDRYNAIVSNDPAQKQFLNGWLARIREVADYSLSEM